MSEKFGVLKEAVPSATPKSGTLKFRIARAHSLGGPAYTVNSSSGRYFNRHLLRNQCITGGIDFDNEISSFRVYQGGTVEFHEDPDYLGKRIRVQAVTQDVYVADLADLKKKSFTIYDGSFDPFYICNRWALFLFVLQQRFKFPFRFSDPYGDHFVFRAHGFRIVHVSGNVVDHDIWKVKGGT